ncbi:MAG: hypothetical protein II301_00210 [Peptococcaceae bacterium]|jgi:hypothetical protein|nr:hypothetical protein [Peptococcaceae bacterium]MBQ2021851.1 hypothetical protein [Peptococcaceae bacterium]MBQ2368528.1 hypothetical protein [Peptococcaceae bacterium]MBQ2431875.1 hypothetical protein [Peptococcaceae bacterium]MBQ5369248.1 hypothetical protein [Peptococcaceae bacterium]
MLESVLFPGALGFAWGLGVSLFNNFFSWRALSNPKSVFSKLVIVFRIGIIMLAMLLVYKNTPMLIGTALGLLAVKNYIFVKNLYILFRERKG